MRRILFGLLLALLPVLSWAQARIVYTPPQGGIISAPLLAPAADNCSAVPYSFTGDTNTGVCSSAADTVGFNAGGTVRLSVTTTGVTSTVPILIPDGTNAAPGIAFSGQTTTGVYRPASGTLGFSANGGVLWGLDNAALEAKTKATGKICWSSSSSAVGASCDTIFTREAAAIIQLGDDVNGSAVAQTIKSHDGITGSNIAGANLTVASGTGTGTGTPGNLIFSTSSTLTTGTTAQTNAERLRINQVAVGATLPLALRLTADAATYPGQTVMPDAGTDGRFDVTTGNATLSIGVYVGTGVAAQGTVYDVVFGGVTYVAPAEDQAITRGHYLLQSATAGYVNDSATVSTDGLNIALALYSEPVSYNIDPTGCGGGGCINTTSGVITLDTDVAAAGWTVGQPVIFWNSGGTTPTGLTDGAVYFLTSVSTTAVTIAATKGGATIVPSAQGDDATQYLQRLPQAVVSIR